MTSKYLTILILSVGLVGLAHAANLCDGGLTDKQCSDKMWLRWQVGERIKYEKTKPSPDQAFITDLEKHFYEIDGLSKTEFSKQYYDSVVAKFREEPYFSSSTIAGTESGFASRTGIFAVLGALVVALIGWAGYVKFRK